MKQKYYTVYKITNLINGMIYIGTHSTKNVNDKYMGSGSNIKKVINEYGVENFKKEILFTFDDKDKMIQKEKELVDENFIAREDTYNIILGGGFFDSTDCISVKDKDGNCLMVHKTDSRYLSGELVGVAKGLVVVKDKYGNKFQVSKDDKRYLNGKLQHINHNKIIVVDSKGNKLSVDKNDSRYLSGELVGHTTGYGTKGVNKNKVIVRNINGEILRVDINDPRYLSGELIHANKYKIAVIDNNGNEFRLHITDSKIRNKEVEIKNKRKLKELSKKFPSLVQLI